MNHTSGINLYRYYVNKNALKNGVHEIHTDNCNLLPSTKTCIDLGIHINIISAIVKARDFFQQLNDCSCCTHNRPIK